ncbi:hypothetical protein, partial [Leptospira levettii]|uniref:hypothetical protein n=1 Tax=Leptospira levettii TaxID=2023178 RepID=UPI00143865DC
LIDFFNLDNALYIITSSYVDDKIIENILKKYKIRILDIRSLYDFTSNRKILRSKLEDFIFENVYNAIIPSEPYSFEYGELKPTEKIVSQIQAFNQAPSEKPEDYCKNLKNIPSGKEHSKEYEEKCFKILHFLFNNDLVNWQIQNKTNSGLDIFDLIARITEKSIFFSKLKDEFSSKYIVFEFKNYSVKIPPSTVYTTERYLFKSALRNIAIIISKLGPEQNTMKAAGGSLIENGKLILFLTDKDLCEMLSLKIKGEDFYFKLEQIVDDFLMKIDRN